MIRTMKRQLETPQVWTPQIGDRVVVLSKAGTNGRAGTVRRVGRVWLLVRMSDQFAKVRKVKRSAVRLRDSSLDRTGGVQVETQKRTGSR